MSKRRRPWGLMGLLGLGGLMMLGARREDDPGSGGGPADDPGPGGSNGEEPTTGELPDLPPPPDDPSEWQGPKWGNGNDDGPTPTPKPTKPGTTGGPKPPTSTPPTEPPTTADPPSPSEDGPPLPELLDPYPRGGRFYAVVEGDRFGGTSSKQSIAYRFLVSEAYLAALEVGGLAHEDAIAWALAVAKQDKVRLKVIDLVQCSGWNDAMYGANAVKTSHASAHGRSILLRPIHGPTASLLAEGESPIRNATMKGNPADDALREYELLWLPAIDRAVLWDSGGTAITTTAMTWADGSTMENPPPWVMELGIADRSGALAGDFGCPGSDGELEVEP